MKQIRNHRKIIFFKVHFKISLPSWKCEWFFNFSMRLGSFNQKFIVRNLSLLALLNLFHAKGWESKALKLACFIFNFWEKLSIKNIIVLLEKNKLLTNDWANVLWLILLMDIYSFIFLEISSGDSAKKNNFNWNCLKDGIPNGIYHAEFCFW